MKRIIWSEDAISDYENNIDYLLINYGVNEAQEFIDEVNEVLCAISEMPELFPMSDYRDIRKCVVRKQISIFYKVGINRIEIVRFWDNRQEPKRFLL